MLTFDLSLYAADRWRAVLRGVKPDYIHAITVHGYKHQRAFLVGQTPLTSTIRNYYQLVFDRMVSCIVQLTGLVEGDREMCAQYWPSRGGEEGSRFGEYTVELEKEQQCEGYVVRTYSLSKDKVRQSPAFSMSLCRCLYMCV